MGLADHTKRVVAQYDFSDDDVNSHVREFLSQMGKPCSIYQCRSSFETNFFESDEGLSKEGTSLSQIPTYVTAVPNGTEKVRSPTTPIAEPNFLANVANRAFTSLLISVVPTFASAPLCLMATPLLT